MRTRCRIVGLIPLPVVVPDAGGQLIAAERKDTFANKRFEIAHAKAHGALALGVGMRGLMERAAQQPYFIAAAGAVAGPLVPVPGGVLVSTDGAFLNAAGVSGDTSGNDEAAALAGIEEVGLVARP